MSFEEKSVWVQLFAMVAVLGGYFVVAGKMMGAGINALPAYAPLFAAAVVAMVLVLAAGHAVAALTGRTDGPDERDRLIRWRAESNSAWILGVGVITAITAMVFAVEPVWTAHLLLFSMVLSETMKYLFQLRYYRRGVEA